MRSCDFSLSWPRGRTVRRTTAAARSEPITFAKGGQHGAGHRADHDERESQDRPKRHVPALQDGNERADYGGGERRTDTAPHHWVDVHIDSEGHRPTRFPFAHISEKAKESCRPFR